jgi:hypothetical protein
VAFVQIIEFRTSQLDEMRIVGEQWDRATEGKRKARRRVLCQDRDHPGRYLNIVFFDSYEEAMENSSLPETDTFSKKMMNFAEGPPTFHNLEVEEDQSL